MPRHKYGAEPLATEQPELATTDTTISPEPSSDSTIRPMKQQSRAIQARWAAEQAVEDEIREFFLSTPLEKALGILAKMRANCTTAGQILNGRINAPGDQKCKTCKITYEELKKKGKPDWWLNRPYYDSEDRNIIHVSHFCSAACVSQENNKTQGVRGVADQGMLPGDNPKNHPHQTHAAQTELAKRQ
jgi:hypothetical protein